MLRATPARLGPQTRAFLQCKSPPSATAPFHRLCTRQPALGHVPRSLPRGPLAIWRSQYSSKPYVNESEIKKQEKEAAKRKLESDPESVTSESTTTPLFEPKDQEGTTVT